MKVIALYNEEDLLARIVMGDESAFVTLFHHYKDKIYSVALRLTESTFIAEEVVQDIFLKLWLKRDALSMIKDFESYLFIMARNQVFSALKKSARQKQLADDLALEIPTSENATYNALFGQECEKIIGEAVDLLPPQQKQIYLLSKEQELKREEIAKLLQISPDTVKAHLSKAIKRIRAYRNSQLGTHFFWLVFLFLKD
ncbi:RNA polymerase sigma factor [Larkinella arboricola]